MSSAAPPSTLTSTWQILRTRGLRREVPLVGMMVVAGLIDGIGVAALFPILGIVTKGESHHQGLRRIFVQVLDFLHLPMNLAVLCCVVLAAIWLKAGISLVVDRWLGRISARVAEDMRLRLLQGLTRARWSYFTTHPVGRFVTAVTSEANWSAFVFRSTLRAVEQTIRTIIYCAVALLMGWRMAAIAIVMGILLGLSLRTLTRAARAAGRARQALMRAMSEDLNDVLTGFKPLKAMNRHSDLMRELVRNARRMRRAVNALVTNQALSDELPDLVQTYLLAAGIYLAATFFSAPVGTMVVAGVVAMALMSSIARVRRAFSLVARGEAAYWALRRTTEEVEAAAESGAHGGGAVPSFVRGCTLRDVTFSYGRGPVLRHASLEIPVGKITAMIGPSGSGKSTIADLLAGLCQPESGAVLIDGQDLRDIDLGRWRDMIGYVAQEIILFNDTIRANVALDDESVGEARVRDACRAAGLGEVLDALPEGLETRVGERGLKLSGGQRQRIALARALLYRPKLLILDEATSALDPTTEAEICATIARQPDLTVLAITHQASWVDRADRVYRVTEGRVERCDRAAPGVAAAIAG
ncbi:MAG TPA: ABC transporter ATP-binding protein [Alphaproteobacteria bacterium]|nr:ABC transporter ATP-binding protein [Alphaproteobacteria bacterium]